MNVTVMVSESGEEKPVSMVTVIFGKLGDISEAFVPKCILLPPRDSPSDRPLSLSLTHTHTHTHTVKPLTFLYNGTCVCVFV